MYDISFKNLKKGLYFGSFFLLIGLLLTFIYLNLTFSTRIKKAGYDSSVKASSISDECSNNSSGVIFCIPKYKFEVNGKIYTCLSNSNTHKQNYKYKQMVYYNSEDPNDCLTEDAIIAPAYMYFLCVIPLTALAIGVHQIIKTTRRICDIKSLMVNGTLIKGVKYQMDATKKQLRGKDLFVPVVEYTLPDGKILKLIGDPRYDHKYQDEDGLIDLLIDFNNPNNYFLDYDIKRK